MTGKIEIGRFTICPCSMGGVWIQINQGECEGEGMQISDERFLVMLEKFWREHF